MEVPGPLLETVGVRVMETDSAEPHVANPITLHLRCGRDLISGRKTTAGEQLTLQPTDVLVITAD